MNRNTYNFFLDVVRPIIAIIALFILFFIIPFSQDRFENRLKERAVERGVIEYSKKGELVYPDEDIKYVLGLEEE